MVEVTELVKKELPGVTSTEISTLGAIAVIGADDVREPLVQMEAGLAYEFEDGLLRVIESVELGQGDADSLRPANQSGEEQSAARVTFWLPTGYGQIINHDLIAERGIEVKHTRMELIRVICGPAGSVVLEGLNITSPDGVTTLISSEEGDIEAANLMIAGKAEFISDKGEVTIRDSRARYWSLPNPLRRSAEGAIQTKVHLINVTGKRKFDSGGLQDGSDQLVTPAGGKQGKKGGSHQGGDLVLVKRIL